MSQSQRHHPLRLRPITPCVLAVIFSLTVTVRPADFAPTDPQGRVIRGQPAGAARDGKIAEGGEASPWKQELQLLIREYYDSNVYWYPETDMGNRDSWVTSIQPTLGARYADAEKNLFLIRYAPDFSAYHDEPTEDYQRHTGILVFRGGNGPVTAAGEFTVSFTDGGEESVVWTGRGGNPAAGGYPLRDRRKNLQTIQSFSLRHDLSPAFVRAAYLGLTQDSMVRMKSTPGYQNFLDLNLFEGGLDAGTRLADTTDVYLAGRYGVQEQPNLFTSPNNYGNQYQRLLAGAEGSPAPWLKIKAHIGPTFRQCQYTVPENRFDRNRTSVTVNSKLTFLPSPHDTLELTHLRFEWLSISVPSMYDNATYSLAYRRTFDGEWADVNLKPLSVSSQLTVNETNLLIGPRRDRIYMPKIALEYRLDDHVTVGLDYEYRTSESGEANTPAREFQEHITGIQCRIGY